MTEIRRCECGCGEPLPPRSSSTRKYIDGTHGTRLRRARLREPEGQAWGPGSPSPRPPAAPPTRRPPPDEPPCEIGPVPGCDEVSP